MLFESYTSVSRLINTELPKLLRLRMSEPIASESVIQPDMKNTIYCEHGEGISKGHTEIEVEINLLDRLSMTLLTLWCLSDGVRCFASALVMCLAAPCLRASRISKPSSRLSEFISWALWRGKVS